MMMMMMMTTTMMMAWTGSLQIRQSLESDEGRYECVAENNIGIAYSYAADLYVRGTVRRSALQTTRSLVPPSNNASISDKKIAEIGGCDF